MGGGNRGKTKVQTLRLWSKRRNKGAASNFNEIEDLAKAMGKTRAVVVRLLLSRGLAEYRRDETLTAQATMPLAEARAGSESGDDR